MILGIAGKIASGKSSLAKNIQEYPQMIWKCFDTKRLQCLLEKKRRNNEQTKQEEKNTSKKKQNFKKRICILEIDAIGHALLAKKEIKQALVQTFGKDILASSCEENEEKKKEVSQKINRTILRQKVLSSLAELEKLEKILHPQMHKEIQKNIKNWRETDVPYSKKNIVIVCALPKTFGLETVCDDILFLREDKKTAWNRVKKRNPLLKKSEFEVLWERQEKEYTDSV